MRLFDFECRSHPSLPSDAAESVKIIFLRSAAATPAVRVRKVENNGLNLTIPDFVLTKNHCFQLVVSIFRWPM